MTRTNRKGATGTKKTWSRTSLVGDYMSLFEVHITLIFKSEVFAFIGDASLDFLEVYIYTQ